MLPRMRTLVPETLNAAYDVTESRAWWRTRLTAIALTVQPTGAFTWQVTQKGHQQKFAGASTYVSAHTVGNNMAIYFAKDVLARAGIHRARGLIAAVVVWWLVVKGTYATVEKLLVDFVSSDEPAGAKQNVEG